MGFRRAVAGIIYPEGEREILSLLHDREVFRGLWNTASTQASLRLNAYTKLEREGINTPNVCWLGVGDQKA
jgi:hypothetical protein